MSSESQEDSPLAPRPAAFGLRMLAGPTVGKNWPVTEGAVSVGRSMGCLLYINDPHVSRIQCEIVPEAAGLRLRKAGGRNPTYVNGEACEGAFVTTGDVISFAGISLIVEQASPAGLESETGSEGTRTTQQFGDALHLRQRFDADAYSSATEQTEDLHQLFQLVRILGRAESLDELCSQLLTHVMARVGRGNLWLAWRVLPAGDLILYPPRPPEETEAAPRLVLEDARTNGLGVVRRCAIDGREEHCMAAPLIHAGEAFGAIAATRDMDAGAFTSADLHYLLTVAEISAPLIRAAERIEQTRRDTLANSATSTFSSPLIGNSASMRKLDADIRRAAGAKTSVLVVGETGVGKELAARMIHDLSACSTGPYVAVNCAAIPAELFESEMFGHERGAFTGAMRLKKGFFEQAHGGTLFLDEISDLSATNQARLLRAVETGAIRRIGAERELHVDVRVVSATNKELGEGSPARFRTDLYHRVAALTLRIPPLRERRDDIVELAHHFLVLFSPEAPVHPNEFTHDALDKLRSYAWPGNVRELRNVVECACHMTLTRHVDAQDIHIEGKAVPLPQVVRAATLKEAEHALLTDILRNHKGNVSNMAKSLGMSRSGLYHKLARHGINVRARGKNK